MAVDGGRMRKFGLESDQSIKGVHTTMVPFLVSLVLFSRFLSADRFLSGSLDVFIGRRPPNKYWGCCCWWWWGGGGEGG